MRRPASLFALPIVGRAGLGNMLFPWARAEVFARRSGARVLRPRWNTVRLGPYLRREPDKRNYLGFFDAPDHVDGMARLAAVALCRRRAEDDPDAVAAESMPRHRFEVVVFRGLADYFAPLLHEHAHIRDRLWQMTRPALRANGAKYGGHFIAMHLRRGDLTRQAMPPQQIAQYTPTSWFAGMVGAVRRRPELAALPIVVFTDGSGDEIQPLLALERVHLHRRGTAIADLWTLAHASLLFASGFSTFSMWASYLGRMPTVYAPGKIQQKVQSGREALELELAEGDDIADAVVRRCR